MAFYIPIPLGWGMVDLNKKLSWCWQTRATRLEISQGH